MTYLNIKTSYGTETVDQLNKKDFSTTSEYRKELRRLVAEYHLVGMAVYTSQRSTKGWRV